MKHLVTSAVTVLALTLGTAAFAQEPQSTPSQSSGQQGQWRHHAPNPEREIKMLTRRLQLTPDQASAIEPILADRDQKLDALKPAAGTTPDYKALHAQRQAIMQDTTARIDPILNDTQKQQLAAMHQHGGRGQHGNWNKGTGTGTGTPASNPGA